MTSEALTDVVKRALLAALPRHSKSLYGCIVDTPQIANHGDYVKVQGYFGIHDVAQDIAAAVQAHLNAEASS